MDYQLSINKVTKPVEAQSHGESEIEITIDGETRTVAYAAVSDHLLHLEIDGKRLNAYVSGDAESKTIVINGMAYLVQDADVLEQRPRKRGGVSDAPSDITPKTPSVVVAVPVKVGDAVSKGQTVVLLSAMKMETALTAPFDGTVSEVNTAEGDKVAPGDILVVIEKKEEEPEA